MSDFPENSRYHAALRYLNERTNYETFRTIPYAQMADGLARLAETLEFLGRPDRSFRVIHVAGTKGKGTVSMMIEAILRRGGVRTGLFTSPHLMRIEERFALDGSPCSADDFAETVWELREALERFDRQKTIGERPARTFFEISLLAAFLLFKKKRVEWAVLETGLGGRFDATNLCEPSLCVITEIGYDHQEQLGATLAEIASEKAGIIKRNVPVVSGVWGNYLLTLDDGRNPNALPPLWRATSLTAEAVGAARNVVRTEAERLGAPLTEVNSIAERWRSLPLATPGRRARLDAAVAIAAVEILARRRLLRFDPKTVAPALEERSFPARIEIVRKNPLCVVDGAHNRQSAEALAEAIREMWPNHEKTLFFAATAGKDIDGMMFELFPLFDRIFLTSYPLCRALTADELALRAESFLNRASDFLPHRPKIQKIDDFSAAVEKIVSEPALLNRQKFICFTGSFYFASAALKLLKNG